MGFPQSVATVIVFLGYRGIWPPLLQYPKYMCYPQKKRTIKTGKFLSVYYSLMWRFFWYVVSYVSNSSCQIEPGVFLQIFIVVALVLPVRVRLCPLLFHLIGETSAELACCRELHTFDLPSIFLVLRMRWIVLLKTVRRQDFFWIHIQGGSARPYRVQIFLYQYSLIWIFSSCCFYKTKKICNLPVFVLFNGLFCISSGVSWLPGGLFL